MAKLNDDWFHAFNGGFEEDEDIIEFIFEHLDTNDFEDSYIDAAGYHEPNEMFKFTKEDKKQLLYDFMIALVEKANKAEK